MADQQTDTVRTKPGPAPEEVAGQIKNRWVNIVQEHTQERGGRRSERGPEPEREKSKAERLREKAEDAEHDAELKEAKLMLAPLIHAGLAPLVERVTPEQPYKMTEAQAFADAFVEVGDKYSDSLLLDFKEEIALIACCVIQFYPRYALWKSKQRAAQEVPLPTGRNINEQQTTTPTPQI